MAGRPVYDARRDGTDPGSGIDLVVRDLVPTSLELDRAEEELRRPLPRARCLEAGEPPWEVDEGDLHARGRLPGGTLKQEAGLEVGQLETGELLGCHGPRRT